MVPLNRPQIQNNEFPANGFNDFDQISAVYGDRIPK
jgi:hypothetical protein